jgi:hypothetical protein
VAKPAAKGEWEIRSRLQVRGWRCGGLSFRLLEWPGEADAQSGASGHSVRASASALVVVTVVAMVALPPLIDRDYLVLENRLGEWLIPRAAVLEVHTLEERTAKPVN